MIDINYLSDYLPEIELIQDVVDCSDKIPPLWNEILKHADQRIRKSKIIEAWSGIFNHDELSNSIQFMQDYLEEIHLIKSEHYFSLIYVYQIEDEVFYRQGRNAKCITNNLRWNNEIKSTAENLLTFYTDLHDGWFEPESESMGLLPSEEIAIIGYQEWDIVSEIEFEKDLNQVISIFSNGGSGYLCIDLNSNPKSALVWWSDDQPDLDLKLFDVLDEWIVIGFE